MKHARPVHCLASGYLKTSDGIINTHVNNNVTELMSPAWESLLQVIGSSLMLHLLLETNLYLATPGNCLVQVSGIPVTDLPDLSMPHSRLLGKRKLQEESRNTAPNKRKASVLRRPNEISFARYRILFQSPTFNKRELEYGLPKKHHLNRSKDHAHIAKYMLPHQFKLKSIYTVWNDPRTTVTDDTKEVEIACQGKVRVPKRLDRIWVSVDHLIQRHSRFPYRLVLKEMCPIPLLDSQTILTAVSNVDRVAESIASISQRPSPPPDAAKHLSSFEDHLHDFAIPYYQVARFVKAAVHNVIPHEFLGNIKNRKAMDVVIDRFISMQRYETMTLHDVLQGISTEACEWLVPPGMKMAQRTPRGEQDTRKSLLGEFIYWLIDSYVIPLLQVNFFITTGALHRNKVHYFRKDFWHKVATKVGRILMNKMYQKTDIWSVRGYHDRFEINPLGYTVPRLLPRDTGVRIIINMSRRMKNCDLWDYAGTMLGGHPHALAPSINMVLSKAQEALQLEVKRRPELYGAGVTAPSELYQRLKTFKHKVRHRRLFFVKVDVKGAFDNIPHEKLIQVVEKALVEDSYIMQGYSAVHLQKGLIRREYAKKAKIIEHRPQFSDLVNQAFDKKWQSIYVHKANMQEESRENLTNLLKIHIDQHIVKMGSSLYRQEVGIPQGSTVSSTLCNLLYAELEKQLCIQDDGFEEHSLMVRYVDDFLFMTTDRAKASRFLTQMHKGNKEFGCFINPSKSLVNFKMRIGDLMFPSLAAGDFLFPWCGYLINIKNLDIMSNYSTYVGTELKTAHTVQTTVMPGNVMIGKLFQRLSTKIQPIFLDTQFNSLFTVLLNLYQAMLMTAMKMHVYLLAAEQCSNKIKWRTHFIVKNVRTLIKGLSRLVERNLVQVKVDFDIHPAYVSWLAAHAFQKVLLVRQWPEELLQKRPGPYSDDLFNMLKQYKAPLLRCHPSMVKTALSVVNPSLSPFIDGICLEV